MINSVAELLAKLIEAEKRKLDEFSFIEHPGMIGDMYEGLARTALRGGLAFDPLDIRVVQGKIRNSSGTVSRQLDCMVVLGDGVAVPHTNHWIYPPERVLAVIEVKKTLYQQDLADAIDLLADLKERVFEPCEIKGHIFYDAWRLIRRTRLPFYKDVDTLPLGDQFLYHALCVEAQMPVRVVLGFDGYKSEATLREGLVGNLSARLKRESRVKLGPVSLPSLIMCRNASVVKLNGMPYGGPYYPSTGNWVFYGTTAENPLRILLELLWTRIDYAHGVSADIFGDDLETEGVSPLLTARPTSNPSQLGWDFEWTKRSEADLQATPCSKAWQPPILSEVAFEIVMRLCADETIQVTDPSFIDSLAKSSTSAERLLAELDAAGLVGLDGDKLFLLTDQCDCAIVPEYGLVAAENSTGRLTRWVAKYMDDLRSKDLVK